MKSSITILCLLMAAVQVAIAEAPLRYRDRQVPLEQRVDDLCGRLTLDEKVNLCHGGFLSGGVPRLGIPQLAMLDGRQGLRPLGEKKGTSTTLLPCTLGLACTWDEKAAEDFGGILAEEMLALDQHVLLAPMINLVRSPLGGRNFENFGEDPLLAGRVAAAYVRGVQTLHVGACACLVAANDCETRRHFTSSNMDERTLREVHLLPTELSFRDGGVWTMMSANSLLNGIYCAQNRRLLQEIVKDQIGFDGVMITDWRAAYDTVPTALAGTDMTTGICQYVFGDDRLLEAVKSGQVPMSLLDDKVHRILRLYCRCGLLDVDSRAKGELDSAKHREMARRLGAQSVVLLKNHNHLLPLDPSQVHSLLVTGPAADAVLQGGGSGNVPAAVRISPLQGLQAAWAGKARVTHLPYNVPLQPRMQRGTLEWEQAARAATKGSKKGGDDVASTLPDQATLTKAAQSSDVVIFLAAGVSASEGRDLPDMELPGGQAEAIAVLAKANPNLVVVLVANGAVALKPWLANVPALLAAHYAGQATGDALADVLTGKVNPAGKLSYTFAGQLSDYPCHALGEWPAKLILDKDPVDPGMKPAERKATHAFDTDYQEGVFVGYRWFDEKQIEPQFPFGYGLSYTTFELSDLKVAQADGALCVSCLVKNTGDRAGAEVVQVYVAPPKSSVPRPPKELKGFAKVMLQPGESRRVSVALRPSAIAFYDVASNQWKADAGDYEIQVGCSSRDVRLRTRTTLAADRLIERF
jgi:beta-glucosidase